MIFTRKLSIGSLAIAFAALLAGFGLLHGGSAQASVTCSKYASPTGSDGAPGTLKAPFRTAQQLVSALQPGETGCLRQGNYTPSGTYVFSMGRSGTPSAPITVTSYPGEHATIKGIVQVPASASYVTLSDMTFEGTAGMNTVKIYSTGVRIEDNEITNGWSSGSCMMLGSNSAGQALRPVISGNVFHACGSLDDGNKDHGIYAANVYEGQIVDNLFYDSAAYAIQLYPNAQKTTFAHNVVNGRAPSVRGGLVFGGDEEFTSNDNVVEQNVIAFAATYDIASVWGGAVGNGNIARNNCLYGGGQGQLSNSGGLTASGNLTANPRFVDAASDDFRLAADSACLTKVGYDTVAQIESNGVIPAKGGSPPTSPPAEGDPAEEESQIAPPVEESSPTPVPPAVPPVITSPPDKPGGGGKGTGQSSGHGGGKVGGGGKSAKGSRKRPRVRTRAWRTRYHAKAARAKRAFGTRKGRRAARPLTRKARRATHALRSRQIVGRSGPKR